MQLDSSLPGAEPFFYPGTSGIGCVLGHGFTSSPYEMRWVGRFLAEQGHSVYGVRLAGHGLHHQALRGMAWQNWLASMRDGYELLRSQTQKIILVGHSLSGILALYLSTQVEVAGAVVMAAPITVAHANTQRLLQVMRVVRPYLYMPDTSNLGEYLKGEQAKLGEPTVGRVRYDFWAASAILQFYECAAQGRAILPKVTIPLSLIYAEKDQTAFPNDMDYIKSHVGSQQIEEFVLPNATHNLQLGADRQQVFERIGQFVAGFVGA